MLEFKRIELSDKNWIKSLLALSDFRGCEYTFGNNFMWKDVFDITVSRFQDYYICRQGNSFVFPAGNGDVKELISQLKKVCDAEGIPLVFNSMCRDTADMLKEVFPGEFIFSTNEDLYDYVYTSRSLSTLSGKKLHSKRNFINRFKTNNWSFEEITKDNIDDCKKMSLEWCTLNECEKNSEKSEEMCAVKIGLDNYFELDFQGGLLRIDGRAVAFSFGERLNSDTFDTHVEKAFSDIVGSYPMINYMMANTFCGELKYINREEDMGEENLRTAKRSYKPCFMIEKYKAEYKGE